MQGELADDVPAQAVAVDPAHLDPVLARLREEVLEPVVPQLVLLDLVGRKLDNRDLALGLQLRGHAPNRRPSPFVYHHPHDAFNAHARMSSRHSSPSRPPTAIIPYSARAALSPRSHSKRPRSPMAAAEEFAVTAVSRPKRVRTGKCVSAPILPHQPLHVPPD